MSRVAIVRGTDLPDMTVRAMEMVDAKPVLIKPNYIDASYPSTGITTDARVIEGVVAFKHLSLAEECGLGTYHLERIQVLGEPIETVRRKFRTSFLSKIAQI
jgi:uncharacterized protein (DUF362 family)